MHSPNIAIFSMMFLTSSVWAIHALYSNTGRQAHPIIQKVARYSGELFVISFPLFLVYMFFYAMYFNPTNSMAPNSPAQSFLFVDKNAYGFRSPISNNRFFSQDATQPKRGEVVGFKDNFSENYFVKRVVGVAGDVVEYRYQNKTLTINGVQQEQRAAGSYIAEGKTLLKMFYENVNGNVHKILVDDNKPAIVPEDISPNFVGKEHCQFIHLNRMTCKVPAGHYFVMGDNRDNSYDSRYWGFVPDKNLVGRVIGSYSFINK